MELQAGILLLFASLHNPVTDIIARGITMLGVDMPLTAIIILIYWCMDKRKGFAITMNMFGSVTVMNVLKSIVRFPRPWKVIEGLDSIQENSSGYSFPSGHATCSSSSYGAMAYTFKKKWFSVICAVVIALVAFSRIYLCVHWPLDVFFGLLIGCGSTFLLVDVYLKLYDMKEKAFRGITAVAIALLVCAVAILVPLTLEKIDYDAFSDLSKNLCMVSGCLLGYVMERKSTDFQVEEGHTGRKILRYVIGMAVVLFLFAVLKTLLVNAGLYNPVTAACRYLITGFWACGIYPYLGVKAGLFEKGKTGA